MVEVSDDGKVFFMREEKTSAGILEEWGRQPGLLPVSPLTY